MKLLQIATTAGRPCGVGNFALNLAEALTSVGVEVDTVTDLVDHPSADAIVVHHGWELFDDDREVGRFAAAVDRPVVVVAHYHGAEKFAPSVSGFIAMAEGIVGATTRPTLIVPHPAWTPAGLEQRSTLREEFSLPHDRKVVGSNGFLVSLRAFPQIVESLVPVASDNGWFIDLSTSEWYRGDPEIVHDLQGLSRRFPDLFRFNTVFLKPSELNRRLQACDLLWCWTSIESTPYGSGSISDQYASGTRIVAADKVQHEHVLRLPNVVRAPEALDPFVDRLRGEMAGSAPGSRHDPEPVSWRHITSSLASFLDDIVTGFGRPGLRHHEYTPVPA